MKTLPPTLLCDFYKVSHKDLYPKGTTYIYSNLTPRSNKYLQSVDEVVVFGIQGFIKKYLVDYFNENFFSRPLEDVVNEYQRVIKFCLGIENPDSKHIEQLHELGYLPVMVRSIEEGTRVPLKTPVLTIENTHADFFWLTNYLETLLSTELWQAMTSASKSYQMYKLLDSYANSTTSEDKSHLPFQSHDFSMRGMSSLESAMLSGAGHLLSFSGTDTIPAILYLEQYYKANIEEELVGASVVASEHSIMSSLTPAEGDRDEYEAYKYLLTEACPEGIMSVVSDTYDLWRVVTETLPRLKDVIMNRNGKLVVRPDSGLPTDILAGTVADPSKAKTPEEKGLIQLLWEIFGGTINSNGYKVLDPHIGAIYGDSINFESAKEILERLKAKGFASSNVVLGVGSFTYQYNSRDSLGFAMKATHAIIDGQEVKLKKDPATDDGLKRSLTGMVVVKKNRDGQIETVDNLNRKQHADLQPVNYLKTRFKNGVSMNETSLQEIREKLKGGN